MKKLLLLLCLFATTALQAQMRLKGKFSHAKPGEKVIVNVPYDVWYHKQNSQDATLNEKGEFSFELPVKKPQTAFLDFAGERLYLYAEPGKTLTVQADVRHFTESLKFTGDLSSENTFRYQAGLTRFKLYPQPWNDTLSSPTEILASIRESQAAALQKMGGMKFKNESFARITEADITYFASSKLFSLIYKNNVWSVGHTSKFPRQEWLQALKEAYAAQPLSNAAAIGSHHYGQTITYYPRFLEMTCSSKDDFMRLSETIFQKPFAEVNEEVQAKGEKLWEYKAINYGLEGLALESAIASFLINALGNGELEYVPEAYADFTARFPKGRYLPHLEEAMKPLIESQQFTSSSEIELDENSPQYKTLEAAVASHKGRVVYVDMWGSWCGPCREEFSYVPALKDRFKGKAVDFVYIAFEHSTNPEKTWKETIAFYGLAGKHILGNKELEKYFEALYANKGSLRFPSYLLLSKEGKIVTVHAERPSAGEKLYSQIEELLN